MSRANGSLTGRIVELMRSAPGTVFTLDDIVREVQAENPTTVRTTVARLVGASVIRRVNRGQFCATSSEGGPAVPAVAVAALMEEPVSVPENLAVVAVLPMPEAPAQEPVLNAISGFSVSKVDRGIIYPTVDKNFFVEADKAEALEAIRTLSLQSPQNALITGPQGNGKTEMAIWFAAKYGRSCLIMNCATIRETKDWFGYRDAKAGSLSWHRSDFVRAIEMGNCVIVLDEFNRLHTTLHNALYPLLDARRSSFIEELDEIVCVGPGTIFFATANIGFSHTGTHTLDSAIEDRFGFRIDLDFLPPDKEAVVLAAKTGIDKATAEKLARFGRDVRRKAQGASATLSRMVSTRQLLQTAVLMKEFATKKIAMRKALDFTVVPYYSKEGGHDSEQAQVLQLIQGIFG